MIRCEPDQAEAHCQLGRALQEKGQLREALEALQRGHELGVKDPNWPAPVRAVDGGVSATARCVRVRTERTAALGILAPSPRALAGRGWGDNNSASRCPLSTGMCCAAQVSN